MEYATSDNDTYTLLELPTDTLKVIRAALEKPDRVKSSKLDENQADEDLQTLKRIIDIRKCHQGTRYLRLEARQWRKLTNNHIIRILKRDRDLNNLDEALQEMIEDLSLDISYRMRNGCWPARPRSNMV